MTSPAVVLVPARSEQMIALRGGATCIDGWGVPTDGLDPPEVLDILAALYSRLEIHPGWGSWLITKDGMIVGGCSLTEPPEGNSCMIGYSVFPGLQDRGYATSAVAQLLDLLRARGLATVRAETSVGNEASQIVLARNGFVRDGERFDPDDGDLVIWQRSL